MPPSSFRWSKPSTTTLRIPLLSRYVSGANDVVARIELGRQDGWKSIGSGEGKELSVLTAFINGRVRPQGVRLVPPSYFSRMNINLFLVRGVVSRFPFLSGIVASAAFLAVSFFVLAVCLVPALRWQYGSGPTIPKAVPSARSRALPDALGERRVRKRSLKRSGSVGPIKREVR